MPPCNDACPAGENVQRWLYHAEEGGYEAAWRQTMEDNPFPAIMGRVCYHASQTACNRAKLDEAVVALEPGRTVTDAAALLHEFDGVFLAVGAQLSRRTYLPADDSARILEALSVLRDVADDDPPGSAAESSCTAAAIPRWTSPAARAGSARQTRWSSTDAPVTACPRSPSRSRRPSRKVYGCAGFPRSPTSTARSPSRRCGSTRAASRNLPGSSTNSPRTEVLLGRARDDPAGARAGTPHVHLRRGGRRIGQVDRAVRGTPVHVLRQLFRVRQLLRHVPRQRDHQAWPRTPFRHRPRLLQGLRHLRRRMPRRARSSWCRRRRDPFCSALGTRVEWSLRSGRRSLPSALRQPES
jgi:Dihydroprymidine dehydrogenase domain II, 4Fe-4S cluster